MSVTATGRALATDPVSALLADDLEAAEELDGAAWSESTRWAYLPRFRTFVAYLVGAGRSASTINQSLAP